MEAKERSYVRLDMENKRTLSSAEALKAMIDGKKIARVRENGTLGPARLTLADISASPLHFVSSKELWVVVE